MEALMSNTHSASDPGESTWRIDEPAMVVADEIMYATVGSAYTSTGLPVGAWNFTLTVQS